MVLQTVKFLDLSDFCRIRPKPITHAGIAGNTLKYGRAFDRSTVSKFFGGMLNPTSPAFKVIRRTIEGECDIKLDMLEYPRA